MTINKDGKDKYEWRSGYDSEASAIIFKEAFFLFAIFVLSIFFLFFTWKEYFTIWISLSSEEALELKKYSYYAFSGMLGGIIFGMKYFYRVIARGYWRQDRIYWRIMSPFIAMAIALMIGAMIDACLINAPNPINDAVIVSIGFLAGYFADDAVGKMQAVAEVIFGNYKGDKKAEQKQ